MSAALMPKTVAPTAVSPVGMKLTPIEKQIGRTVVRLQQGDLTALEVEAFVFYAREDLALGSGYGTAIQMRGGAAVKKDLEKIGKLQVGEAAVTTAGEMKAKFIVHACGPKFQEPELEKKLVQTMSSALTAAHEKGIKVLAFPPLGAGFYGAPLDLSARVMLDTIKSFVQGSVSLQEIVICVVDGRDFGPFKKQLESL